MLGSAEEQPPLPGEDAGLQGWASGAASESPQGQGQADVEVRFLAKALFLPAVSCLYSGASFLQGLLQTGGQVTQRACLEHVAECSPLSTAALAGCCTHAAGIQRLSVLIPAESCVHWLAAL